MSQLQMVKSILEKAVKCVGIVRRFPLVTDAKSLTVLIMYCIVLYCIVLYCIVLYCIVLYCIVLYCIVLYCIVLYCIVLYCIVLYCIVLYCCIDCLIKFHPINIIYSVNGGFMWLPDGTFSQS